MPSFQSFHNIKILSFPTVGLGLNLGTGFFHQNQSQTPSGNLTPGIVSEDFPALAPPKAAAITKPTVPIAVPPIALPVQKVVTMKNPGSDTSDNNTPGSVWNIRTEEEVTTTVNDALVTVVGTSTIKKRPELPRVDTSSPSATKGERTPTPATGLRMIRILSTQGGLKSAIPQSAVSETASVSGMSSRPVSPPPQQQTPQKKSKSALKRERREKERKEAEEKERELEREKEREKERLRKMEEEVHAPVVGRMKKKDKKRADGSIESPPSPHPAEDKDESVQTAEKSDAIASFITTNVAPESAQMPTETATTTTKTTAQLLQEMSGINFATLEMFKPIVGLKWELHITTDDLAQIKIYDDTTSVKHERLGRQLQQSGMTEISLRGGGTVATHQLITPGGSVLTGLTQEQEMRFMELEENRKREKSWERYPAAQKDWNALSELPLKNSSSLEGKVDEKVMGKVTLDELERRVVAARKETEGNEKKLEKLLKRNKRLVGLA